VIAYKFLGRGGRAPSSERDWPLPTAGQAGAWLEAESGPLEPWSNGVHACDPHDLPYWINDELWQVELAGERISGPQSMVSRKGRLTALVEAWNPPNARTFARGCMRRAEDYVATLSLPAMRDLGAQYMATASARLESGQFAVTAYASAMAFTLQRASAATAFSDERLQQGHTLAQTFGL
jgi:hypothetical protein